MVKTICVPPYLAGLALRVPKKKRKMFISEWVKQDGEPVAENEIVVILDIVKASAELVAESSGILFHVRPIDELLNVKDVIGVIADTAEEFQEYKAQHLDSN